MQINFFPIGRWFPGLALALLFFILLILRLGWLDHNQREAEPTGIHGSTAPAGDRWFAIFREGRRIGYAHRQFSPTDAGYRIREDVLMHINTMGVTQALSFQTEGNLDTRLNLTSFRFYLNSGLFRFHAHGTVRGRILEVTLGQPGEESRLKIDLKAPIQLAAGITEAYPFAGLKPGESRTFHIFDPATLSEQPILASLADKEETILYQGQKKEAWKLLLNFLGARQFVWLDGDGTVLREEGLLGISLEYTSREAAIAPVEESADLTELAALPTHRTLPPPATLGSLRVKLANANATDFNLDGGRQSLTRDVLLITRESLPSGHEGEHTAKALPSLLPDSLIQSDHPRIIAAAQSIVAPHDSSVAKARKLLQWVYRNIRKKPVLSVPNALEILKNREGDCNEHAVLLAALSRAAGIPAEVEAGIVYLRGKFYYHAWNALFLEGTWITADATLGQLPADVTHIRFVQGVTKSQLNLLGLIGRLNLKILDYSTAPPAETNRKETR